jgi:hypothetical protein
MYKQGDEAGARELVSAVRSQSTRAARRKATIFLELFGLLLSDDELARSEKHRYADELEYARRHRVPTELLVGFILQSGTRSIAQKVRTESPREPWFNPSRELTWGPPE